VKKYILMVVAGIVCGLGLGVLGWFLAAPMVNYYPDFEFGGLPGYEGWGLLGEVVGFVLGSSGGATIVWFFFRR
jgi:hypothetical protein